MTFLLVHNFTDFCNEIRKAGFSMGGSNNEGIFSLNEYFGENIHCHTEDPETDPWEWRIRAIQECSDIAYSKVFFNKGGWITKDWYPYFLAVRRQGKTFDDMYQDGLISNMEKRIYQQVAVSNEISLHDIKVFLGCTKAENSSFETALTKLQMKMLITIKGQSFKISQQGIPYGWPVTTFCTTERFFGDEVFTQSCQINKAHAIDKITSHIKQLNPAAEAKSIIKFIG